MFNEKSILITGGTGTFGKNFTKRLLANYKPHRIIVLSRDEFKQYEMQRSFGHNPVLRFFLGDVRDKERLYRAFHGVDYVVHAAASKQVVAAEYNPFEAVKTNILGAQNVIEAAIDNNVKRVVALSTDKAANPINLYGATKLASDKLFVAANSYAGGRVSRFGVVRYGNVRGSRGSVLPLFLEQRLTGKLSITAPEMTRFWIGLDRAIDLVKLAFNEMQGGEIFVPKIPSMRMDDFARIIAPDAELEIVGIRPGEKMHEVMIPEDDARHTQEYDDHYRILPEFATWRAKYEGGNAMPEGFRYASDTNPETLSAEELLKVAKKVAEEVGIKF
jgi:UDP-N-acetylglucosamine 4,6-dehydratase